MNWDRNISITYNFGEYDFYDFVIGMILIVQYRLELRMDIMSGGGGDAITALASECGSVRSDPTRNDAALAIFAAKGCRLA